MDHLLLPGNAGNLEAILDLPEGVKRCALLCHPHPLYGGNMSDNVLSVLSNAFLAMSIGTLRFNFRGVGASPGQYDKGVGEVDDVVSAAHWLVQERKISTLYLCGYSFGAAVALNALPRIEVVRSVLVAPPVQSMKVAVDANESMLVILGEEDDIVDFDSTRSFFEGAKVHAIGQANHFFTNAATEFNSVVTEFIDGT